MLFPIAFLACVVCASGSIRGVSPDKEALYAPLKDDPTKWACLNDSSIVIDYSKINDNVCDCPDGSDEPGTNACVDSKTLFYCENEGFIPRRIANYKVDDGVCDCCDCSDEEWPVEKQGSLVRGKSCSELKVEFDGIVEKELANWRAGVSALEKLQGKAKKFGHSKATNQGEENVYIELARMQKYGRDVSEALERTGEAIEGLQDAYKKKLAEQSPQLFEYENMGIALITESITTVFTHVRTLSNAFNELRYILNELYETYNRKVKDKVVARNMRRFVELEKSFDKTFQPDGSLDATQRDQINDYLIDELPLFLFEGKSKYPADIIVAKSNFIKAIITVKLETMDQTIDGIKQFQEIAEDIINNHDINFQDAAVKAFTDSYMSFMSKYGDSIYRVDFPEEFDETFSNLLKFIEREAPKVTRVDYTPEDDSKWGVMRLVKGALNRIQAFSNSPQSYRSQIKVMKEQEVKLRQKLRKTEKQIRELKERAAASAAAELDDADLKHRVLHQQVDTLLNNLNDFCVDSKLNSYIYKLCFSKENGGAIIQIEDKPKGKEVTVGHFKGFAIDDSTKYETYLQGLQYRYPDTEVGKYLYSDTEEIGKQDILLGNLPDLDTGLRLDYRGGDRCWNGPLRSAKIRMRCAPQFTIESVSEPTKCEYLFEMAGPLGCDPSFKYENTHV